MSEQGTQIDEADSEGEARAKEARYLHLLQVSGLVGKWSVRAEENIRDAAGKRTGVTGAAWRVMIYDERDPDDRSVAALAGVLRLRQLGHIR